MNFWTYLKRPSCGVSCRDALGLFVWADTGFDLLIPISFEEL